MSDVTVKVGFLGSLRGYLKRREMEATLPEGSTVADLLEHLSHALGERFTSQVFDPDGRLSHQVSILVDGRSLHNDEVLRTQLDGGQVDVMILPVFEGG